MTVTGYIRATHPYRFRVGEWANILGAPVMFNGRECWHVLFDDGKDDHWPCDDPQDPYEFRWENR